MFPVSLNQTLPLNNLPVCSEGTLIYSCFTTSGVLRWQEGDDSQQLFFPDSEVNNPITLVEFTVELTGVNGDFLTSTATSQMTNSSDAGIRISCRDGVTTLSRDVVVAGKFL